MTRKRTSVRRQRKGFAFLEVVISVAVLGIIASVAIVALNPRDNLLAARDADRKMDVNSLLNAHFQRRIQYGSYLHRSQTPAGRANAKQICTQGILTNPNCINIDELVTEFIAVIPRDSVEPCDEYTGYLTYMDNATLQVYSLHIGKMPGDSDITVTPGCDDFQAVPSSSSSSSVSTSVSSSSEYSSESSSEYYSSESSSSSDYYYSSESSYSSDYYYYSSESSDYYYYSSESSSSSSDYYYSSESSYSSDYYYSSSESSYSSDYYYSSSESSSSEPYCEYWMWWCQSASSEYSSESYSSY